MSKFDYIPRRDEDFQAFVNPLTDYVKRHGDRFNIPESRVSELDTVRTAFNAAMAAAGNAETRTAAAVLKKTQARTALEECTRQFVAEFLVRNRLVTDEDRQNMRVPIHKKTHTRAGIPTTFPILKRFIYLASRVYELFVQDSVHEGRARPDQVRGFEVGYLTGVAGLTVVPEMFTHSLFFTTSPARINFPPEAIGLTLYVAFRWENTRGEKGPWSEVYRLVIG
jgi:hypothetical protein